MLSNLMPRASPTRRMPGKRRPFKYTKYHILFVPENGKCIHNEVQHFIMARALLKGYVKVGAWD